MKRLRAGNRFYFGRYPRGKYGEIAPIEWRVLETDGERATLISRWALDCIDDADPDMYPSAAWECSGLRAWLNTVFAEEAFSPAERERLQTVTTPADANPRFDTDPGGAARDKVYLLSIAEAKKYFPDNARRTCRLSAYARGQWEQHVALPDGPGFCRWRLRSPGGQDGIHAAVHFNGSVDYRGGFFAALRPVITVRLSPPQPGPGAAQGEAGTGEGGLQAGDRYDFGRYPQTMDGMYSAPIEWRVLETDGRTAKLVSLYALDCRGLNSTPEDVTWEGSRLRTWLNGTFFETAFSEQERTRIEPFEQDRVFVPELKEIAHCMEECGLPPCRPTDYAWARGIWKQEPEPEYCWWWIRDNWPVEMEQDAAMFFAGQDEYRIRSARYDRHVCGVRPASVVRL